MRTDDVGGGVVLGISHDSDVTTVFPNGVALRNVIGGVVATFGLDVGANLANDRADIELGKDHDGVDVFERGDDFGAFVLRHDRASGAFESAYGIIGVHGDDELTSEGLGPAQVADMTDMEQVEVAVR